MLEPIPFAGFVEIDDPIVCCNHNCNQGRDCPLRTKTLTDEEIINIAKEHIHQRLEGERFGYLDFARAIMERCGIICGTDK